MIFHCFHVGYAVVDDLAVLIYPGYAVVPYVQSIKERGSLPRCRVCGNIGLRFQPVVVNIGKITVQEPHYQDNRDRKNYHSRKADRTEYSLCHISFTIR